MNDTLKEWIKYVRPNEHHIWCNFSYSYPPEECSMCKGLKKDYPEKDMDGDELMKKHFPNNKKIK